MSELPESGSIAELTALEYMNNMMTIISDQVAMLVAMIGEGSDLQEMERKYEKMRLVKQRGEETKIMLMEYLVKNSEFMMYSRSYIEMVRTMDRFIQHADSVAYRLLIAFRSNIRIRDELLKNMQSMIQRVKQQVDLIREALAKMPAHPRKSMEHVDEVLKLEEEVDQEFRRSIFEVYEKYSTSITGLMILKDLIEYIEELSDLLKNLGEEIRYLSLVKTVAK